VANAARSPRRGRACEKGRAEILFDAATNAGQTGSGEGTERLRWAPGDLEAWQEGPMSGMEGTNGRVSHARRVALRLGVLAVAVLVVAVSVSLIGMVLGQSGPGSFERTGSMATPRSSHTATLLPDGRVLVAGGLTGDDLTPTATAELYDPRTGSFSSTGSMETPRYGHTATLLADGRVLVTGGYDGSSAYLTSAEVYDPGTGRFTPTGSLATARFGHTATLLPDGKVLVAGGMSNGTDLQHPTHFPTSAELYDPATGTFSATGDATRQRYFATATLLTRGRVLVAGGDVFQPRATSETQPYGSAELYDPSTRTFRPVGSMPTLGIGQVAVLLDDGRVIFTGGSDDSIWSYDPASGSFTSAGRMLEPRAGVAAVKLRTGVIVFIGGEHHLCCAEYEQYASAELYHADGDRSVGSGSMVEARANETATLLPDGRVLVAGGENASAGVLDSAELFSLS
jgi:WD40 repeat protein